MRAAPITYHSLAEAAQPLRDWADPARLEAARDQQHLADVAHDGSAADFDTITALCAEATLMASILASDTTLEHAESVIEALRWASMARDWHTLAWDADQATDATGHTLTVLATPYDGCGNDEDWHIEAVIAAATGPAVLAARQRDISPAERLACVLFDQKTIPATSVQRVMFLGAAAQEFLHVG